MGAHRAFTASSMILVIYIQQFWDTMCFNSSTGLYSYQLDEQWFNLHKDILIDALDITPTNDNNPFVAPPPSDTVIEYVNTLGYPCTLRNVSAMSAKTSYASDSLGIIHRSNIDYAERIWEEFVQSTQTFLTDRKNLTTASRRKKKFVRKDGREIFGMSIPDALLTNAIKRAPYYSGYLEHVAEYQRYLDEEHDKAEEKEAVTESPNASKATKPKAAKQTKPSTPKEVRHVNLKKDASYKELTKINTGDQDVGQAGPNPGKQDEGHVRSNPGDAAESQPQSRELKLPIEDQVILEDPTSSTGTLSSLQNLDKELNFTNKFFMKKPQEEGLEKTNTESEVQSMVMVLIHQDTSLVPPVITLVINLTVLQPVSTMVSKTVDEIVTDAVDWAMQAPLRAHFNDLPTVDIKEILQQRMKKRKRRESLRTPHGSPPSQPPPPPPPTGMFAAQGTLGALGSSQLPPPPPHSSIGTSGSAQQQGSKALSLSKTVVTTMT
ncbi:hypothetical protein Tco_1309087 [Tanacetum coccineum]